MGIIHAYYLSCGVLSDLIKPKLSFCNQNFSVVGVRWRRCRCWRPYRRCTAWRSILTDDLPLSTSYRKEIFWIFSLGFNLSRFLLSSCFIAKHDEIHICFLIMLIISLQCNQKCCLTFLSLDLFNTLRSARTTRLNGTWRNRQFGRTPANSYFWYATVPKS